MISAEDTIAAIATPLGEGGLGVIRVSGAKAIVIVSGLFSKNIKEAPANTCHIGIIRPSPSTGVVPLPRGEGESKTQGEGIDQVVVTLFRGPHSYTGEDVVEISAHGNPITLQKILELCCRHGARLAGPGEFTERAFLNGKMDLTQAEAVADLIHAKTDKAQEASLAQLRGGLARRVRALRDQLLPVLAHVEVGLDHSDEEHDFLSREHLISQCGQVLEAIDALLRSTRVSKILRDGYRVAFVGRPNVGKSSLLNALLQEERAIVTPIPGTTRDTLEESVNLNGIPVILTDTAGLRQDSLDTVEQLGMERTRRSLETADAVIGLFDGSEDFMAEDQEVIRTAMQRPHIWAINKSDLPPRFSLETLHALNGQANVVNLSAKTGSGLETLMEQIASLALGEKAPASEAQWLLNARHQAALERAREALVQASQTARSKGFEECVALELQTALGALGEIIGETTTEDLLDQIFSKFCIGK